MSILLIASLAVNAVGMIYLGIMAYGAYQGFKFINSDKFRYITEDLANNIQQATKEYIREEVDRVKRGEWQYHNLLKKNEYLSERLHDLDSANWRLNKKLEDNGIAAFEDIPF